MQGARTQYAGTAGGDAQKIFNATLVNTQESLEHRGYQDRAAFMRLARARVVRLCGVDPDGAPQRLGAAERSAELLSKVRHEFPGPQVAARARDLEPQQFRKTEMLEDRHDVG